MADNIESTGGVSLYDWQTPSKDRLVAGFRAGTSCMVNASATGTGKTLVALQMLKELDRPALIIAPKSVKSTWRRWAEEMGCSDKLLDVVTPERISRGASTWWDGAKWHVPAGAIVIADEVHRGASGPESLFTKALALLRAYQVPVLAQSATLASSPRQLRAVGFLLGLHSFGKESFTAFCRRYGCTYRDMKLVFENTPRSLACLRELHTKIADRLVRIRIEEVPDFPESQLEARLFDLEDTATAEINEAYAEMVKRMAIARNAVDMRTALMQARHAVEVKKAPLLASLALDTVEEGESAVLFVNFQNTVAALRELLTGKVPFIEIHGKDGTEEDRNKAIERFQNNEARVAVIIAAAGGLGLSAHDVKHERPRKTFITPSYNMSEFVQCLGRTHRSGGTKTIQTVVLAAGTVEERVYKSILNKRGNLALLVDDDLAPVEIKETT